LWIIPGKVGSIVYTASKVWILLFPVAWTMLVERRVQGREHLRRREFLGLACSGRGIITGALQGTVIAVLIIGVFLAVRRGIDAGSLRQVAGAAGFGTIRAYVLLGTYLALVNSLLEEYVWRWFVFRAVHSVLGGWGAVIVSAMLFTVHHVVVLLAYFPAWLALLASGGVFIGGVAWSWCFLRFRSILPGYLSHVIVDIAVLVVGWVLLFAPAS
jgi:membrane protease YdiL (CAAX protease family)